MTQCCNKYYDCSFDTYKYSAGYKIVCRIFFFQAHNRHTNKKKKRWCQYLNSKSVKYHQLVGKVSSKLPIALGKWLTLENIEPASYEDKSTVFILAMRV